MIIKAMLTGCIVSVTLFSANLAADDHDSLEYLEIVTDFGADCVSRNALQLLIVNTHPTRPIKAKLFRYYGDVRQPGRSAYVLEPGDDPLALGCDKIQGRAQYWEITTSNYVAMDE